MCITASRFLCVFWESDGSSGLHSRCCHHLKHLLTQGMENLNKVQASFINLAYWFLEATSQETQGGLELTVQLRLILYSCLQIPSARIRQPKHELYKYIVYNSCAFVNFSLGMFLLMLL